MLGLAPGAVQVAGPGDFHTVVTATASLTDLEPGSYVVTPLEVTAGSQIWRPTGVAQSIEVSGGTAKVTITYRLAAELTVVITGLGDGIAGDVRVSGESGVLVTGTNHLVVDQGSHTITAQSTTTDGGTWNPDVFQQTVTLAGGTVTTVTITYAAVTGQLQVVSSGLPPGSLPSGTVTGPGGFTAPIQIVGTSTFTMLTPGRYTVTMAPVIIDGAGWQPSLPTQSVLVSSGQTAVATAQYAAVTGSLDIVITGLIGGATANVTVSGPGFVQVLGTSTLLSQLPPGNYTATALSVPSGTTTLNPTPVQRIVSVVAGVKATASFQYAPATSLTLVIDGLYITQAAQSYSFTAPLVSVRPGLLRVFLKANQANTVSPDVRVRFYNGATLVSTFTISAPGASVPLVVTEGTLTSSWNLSLPQGMLQPGLRMLVDVDPGLLVPLATRDNLVWPASGTPQALSIQAGPVYDLTFIPVTQTSTGATGDVTVADVNDFLPAMQRMHPVASTTIQVHAPVVFNGAAMNTPDASPWLNLLAQIEQLRVLEGSTRYYYGVVKVTSPTWSGFGYIPNTPSVNDSRSAVGWDNRTADILSGASETYAHELGHNLGLFHSPCGNAASPDPAYPYPGAVTGSYGYDIFDQVLKQPTAFDLMSYCSPVWVSDYQYKRMFRASTSGSSALALASPQRTMLISGSIDGSRLSLDPVIEAFTPAKMPTGGPYRLEGRDENGNSLFDLTFAPTRVADVAGDIRHFVYAIPVSGTALLSRLRVSGPGIDSTVIAPSNGNASASPPTVNATRLGGGRVQLRWDATRYPRIVVRELPSGSVLAIARGGDVTVTSSGGSLQVILSEGLRSVTVTVTP